MVNIPGPEVIILFSCSTQLCTKLQLLIKSKIPRKKDKSCFSLLDVGLLTLMSRINFVLS